MSAGRESALAVSRAPTLLLVTVHLLVAAGCSDDRVRPTAGDLFVTSVAPIRFPPTSVGESSEALLRLSNSSRFERRVVLSTAAPFSMEPEWVLAGGEERGLPVRFTPSSAGTSEGTVVVEVEGLSIPVALVAEGRRTPACEPSSPCVRSVWSNGVGACVEEPVEDGTACTAACLIDATCQSGACVGTPRSCDDGNLCTEDLCDPSKGCAHTPSVCDEPPPCMASVCDPEAGCALVPAPDGTVCGRRGCDAQDICLAGNCVARVPPEGAACGFESPCQPLGTCRANQCVRPPAVPLDPAWSLFAGDGQYFRAFGLADEDGNPLLGRQTGGTSELMSLTPAGVRRFVTMVAGRHEWPLLMAGTRIIFECEFSELYSEVCARSALDGSLLWQSDLESALVPYLGPLPEDLVVMVRSAFWSGARLMVVAHVVRGVGPGSSFYSIHAFLLELDPATGRSSALASIYPDEYTRIANGHGATVGDMWNGTAGSMLLARAGTGALVWDRNMPRGTHPLLRAPDGTLVVRTQLENPLSKSELMLLDGATGATRAETGLVTQTFVSLSVANRDALFTWAFDGSWPFLARVDLATGAVAFRKAFGHPELGASSPFSLTLTSKDTLLFVVTANDVPYLAEWGLDGEERFLCRLNAPLPWGDLPKILVTNGHVILYGDYPMDEVHAFPLAGYDTAKNAWATEAANLQGTNSL